MHEYNKIRQVGESNSNSISYRLENKDFITVGTYIYPFLDFPNTLQPANACLFPPFLDAQYFAPIINFFPLSANEGVF